MTPGASTMRKTNSERNLNHKKWQDQHIKLLNRKVQDFQIFLKHKMVNIEMYQAQALKALRENSATL